MIFVDQQSGMDEVVRGLTGMELIGLDCETTGLDPLVDDILLVQLGNDDEQYVIDARQVDLRPLIPILCTSKRRKVLHNAKFDYSFLLQKTGIRLENVIDTMLVEQVIQNGRMSKGFGLAATYHRYTKRTMSKEAQTSFIGHTGEFTAKQLEYAAMDVVYPLELVRLQTPRLVKYGLEHTARLECLAVLAVADMELAGFLVDRERWLQLEGAAGHAVVETRAELDELFKPYREKDMDGLLLELPDELNYDSETQMLPALQWMGVPVGTTNKAQIGHLGKEYPIVQKLLDYREHRKNVTTYGKSFLDHIHPSDGRIHCDFRQMGAESGRMSCTKPNLQNIPSESEYRECFIAPKGHVLVTADYSGCELRIIAELSGDEGFVGAFNAGEDLHSKVATQMFGKTVSKTENAELRAVAKTINFGLAYGMSHIKLAHTMKVSEEEAQGHLETYFKMFPGVAKWLEGAGRAAAARGFATTIGGRRRWFNIEGIDEDRRQRGAVERKGKNTPIQGCLPLDTRILTPGGWTEIGTFESGTVWTGERWAQAHRVDTGEARRTRLTLSDGRTFDCDDRHYLLVNDGVYPRWEHVSKIEGLPLVRDRQEDFGGSWDEEGSFWLGKMVACGHITRDGKTWGAAFGHHQHAEARKFTEWLGDHLKGGTNSTTGWHWQEDARGNVKITGGTRVGVDYWESRGISRSQKARSKRVPRHIFRKSRACRQSFFDGYMFGDGHKRKRDGGAKCTSASRELLADILRLAQTLGLTGRISGKYTRGDTAWWELAFHKREQPLTVVGVDYLDVEPMCTLTVHDERHSFSSEGLISKNTNADMTKLSLHGIRQQLNKARLPAKIVNTVHDEIVVECEEDDALQVQELVERVMQRAGEYYVKSVPMEVESAIRTYWGH